MLRQQQVYLPSHLYATYRDPVCSKNCVALALMLGTVHAVHHVYFSQALNTPAITGCMQGSHGLHPTVKPDDILQRWRRQHYQVQCFVYLLATYSS